MNESLMTKAVKKTRDAFTIYSRGTATTQRKHKIPTIGFQIPSFTQPYHRHMWNGVNDIVRERKANLITFWGETYKFPHYYCYQGNTIYTNMNSRNLDGVIVSSGSICNFAGSKKEFYDFFKPFRDIPTVSLSIKVKSIPSVIIDNTIGFKRAIEHLIVDHGYRKFAFLHGPRNNQEAMLRCRAYQATLRKHGITEDCKHLYFGDFSRYVIRINNIAGSIADHLDEIDAIVSSNDDMLIGLIRELNKLNIKIPDDVAAIGFDNIMEASCITPLLTTVNQPIYKQARLAGKVLFDMLDGTPVDAVYTLPTEPVIRESCGCSHAAEYSVKAARDSKGGTPPAFSVDRILEKLNSFNVHLGTPREAVVRTGIDDILDAFRMRNRESAMKKINGVIERCIATDIEISILLDIIRNIGVRETDPGIAEFYRNVLLHFAHKINNQKSINEVRTDDAYFEISWTIQELSSNIGFDNLLAGRFNLILAPLYIREEQCCSNLMKSIPSCTTCFSH